jgi:hypothetical protein
MQTRSCVCDVRAWIEVMREKQNDKAFANTFSALINELRMHGVCTWGWLESEAFACKPAENQVKTLDAS